MNTKNGSSESKKVAKQSVVLFKFKKDFGTYKKGDESRMEKTTAEAVLASDKDLGSYSELNEVNMTIDKANPGAEKGLKKDKK